MKPEISTSTVTSVSLSTSAGVFYPDWLKRWDQKHKKKHKKKTKKGGEQIIC